MDSTSLDKLLNDPSKRQFWLKPIGYPKDHPEWDAFESRKWTQSQIEVQFAKSPATIALNDIIIAYRIKLSTLIYVAERLPVSEWGKLENRPEYDKKRWPHCIKARNLTPEFGNVWKQHSFQPFALAKEYNSTHPKDPVHLGSIQRGNDKAAIPRAFAEFLIRLIRNAT